jgi:hypothetical protein
MERDAMNHIDANRYDYLRRKRYVVHEEHEQFIRPETLAEMRESFHSLRCVTAKP